MHTKYIDLSHTIHDGLVTYKGLPPPYICDFLSRTDSAAFYEEGTSFQIGKIEMVANTGTYIDCPFHRFENGADLAEEVLEKFVDLPGVCINVPFRDGLVIEPSCFQHIDLKGKAVLLHTGWSALWNTPGYYEGHPYLTAAAAQYLADQQVALVGIDGYNVDDTNTNRRPVHTILLGAGILIVEHMTNLAALPKEGFLFSAVPPKIKGLGSFPVRAFAKVTP